MANNLVVRALGVTLGILAFIGAAAPVKAETQSVTVQGVKNPSDWKRAESAHFVVFSDSLSEDVMRLVNHLERLDTVMRIYLRDYVHAPAAAHKLTFYFHDRSGGFKDMVGDTPGRAVALYSSCPAAVQGFAFASEPIPELESEQLATHTLDLGQSYIFEAYARHFIYRYTNIRAPSAFIEGIAQFFSTVRFSDTQMVLGRTPPAAGYYLAFIDSGYRYSLDYRGVLEDAGWRASDYAESYAGPEGVALEFQAKSWVLTHYMLSTEERRKKMAAFLDLVHDDTPAAAAFERAFGMGMDDLGQAMWRYRRRDAHVIQAQFPSTASIPIDMTTLTRAAGDVVLASAQLKSCPDRKTGEALLGKLIRESGKESNNEFVLLTVSRAQVEWGHPDDAVAPLTALLRTKPGHAEATHLLGLAHLRLAAKRQGPGRDDELAAARRTLAQARALDPGSAETAYALFQAELETGAEPDKAALSHAVAAGDNAREVPSFARTAALAYAYAGQADEAETTLTALAQNSQAPDSAAWARDWRQRLAKGVPRAQLVAEFRRTKSAAAQKEWTIATHEVMRTVECKAKVLEAAEPLAQAQFAPPGAGVAEHSGPRMSPNEMLFYLEQSCYY